MKAISFVTIVFLFGSLTLRCDSIRVSYRTLIQNQQQSTKAMHSALQSGDSKQSITFEDWLGRGPVAESCIQSNERFFSAFDNFVEATFNLQQKTAENHEETISLLLSLHRHWSVEGKQLRDLTFNRIVQAFRKWVLSGLVKREDISSVKVFVPGAGLGRLAFEIASLNDKLSVTALEIDPLLVKMTSFLLEQGENKFEIYPGLHITNNWSSREDRFKSVVVPDVSLSETPDFNYIAGSFPEQAISDANVVLTSFFLDAGDTVQFISSIKQILTTEDCSTDPKFGKLWINDGPLVYPYSRFGDLQLSWDMIRELLHINHFIIVEEDLHPCSFEQVPGQLERRDLTCVYFVARL